MEENESRAIMATNVSVTTQHLSDNELAVLHLVALTDASPHDRLFKYEDVAHLFDQDNGTKMHPETKRALEVVVAGRLASSSAENKGATV